MNLNETAEAEENGLTANYNAADLDEETAAKLKGDAIGDTMYSQTFVTKTLLKLSESDWNDELEEDLCSLWDMTVEKDVCAYLFEVSYPSIACVVVQTANEERLIEMIVGILANIFCANCAKDITLDEINTILNVLESDDPLVLLQVARFIKALTYFDENLTFVTREVIEKLTFITANSLNTSLLTNCLDTFATLCSSDVFTKRFLSAEVYDSCLMAYGTIVGKDRDLLFCGASEILSVFTHLMKIITGFTSYIDLMQDFDLLERIREKNDQLVKEVKSILEFYADDFNLLPITDTFKYFIESFAYNFPILRVGYDGDVFQEVMRIVISLMENNALETDYFSEFLCYLVSNADLEQLRNDSEQLKEKDVVMVLDKFRGSLEACDNEICKQILANYCNK